MNDSLLYYSIKDSPLGKILFAATSQGLCLLEYTNSFLFMDELEKLAKKLKKSLFEKENIWIKKASHELDLFFKGELESFTIPLDPHGTDFQKAVWKTLHSIPYGKTISYKEQSIRLKNPKAIRAMASANGKNPISIIVPCHRVIGSDGSLTGYTGGLEKKRFLLNLESHKGMIPTDTPRE